MTEAAKTLQTLGTFVGLVSITIAVFAQVCDPIPRGYAGTAAVTWRVLAAGGMLSQMPRGAEGVVPIIVCCEHEARLGADST